MTYDEIERLAREWLCEHGWQPLEDSPDPEVQSLANAWDHTIRLAEAQARLDEHERSYHHAIHPCARCIELLELRTIAEQAEVARG